MKKYSEEEFEFVIENFNNKTLPKQKWTHNAHLIVALWHNSNFAFEEALGLVRSKIKEYNSAIGTPNTENSGYHETLTIFWMISTNNFLITQTENNLVESLNNYITINSIKNLPLDYYDKELLLSPEARKRWINGNLKSIELIRQEQKSHYKFTNLEFLSQFKNCEFDPNLFSHSAHLRLAWIVVRENGIQDAIEIISNQIQNYVFSLKAEDKFNMTLTIAAIKIVNNFINKSNSVTFSDFILEFPSLENNFKELIATHYSMDIYNSENAKIKYLEPDLLAF